MKLSRKYLIIGSLVFLALLFVGQSVWAGGPSNTAELSVKKPTGCQIKYTVDYESYYDPDVWPDLRVDLYKYVSDALTYKSTGLDYDLGGGFEAGTQTGRFFGEPGKSYRLRVWNEEDGTLDTLDVSVPDECDGPPEWYFSVEGLGSGMKEAAVPMDDGTLACALFDVLGWGAKVVDLADYPECAGNVAVYCLNDAGEWTADNVSKFMQDGTVVSFMSSQHGTCGFFPAP